MKNYLLLAISIVAGIVAFALGRMKYNEAKERLARRFRTEKVLAVSADLVMGDKLRTATEGDPGNLAVREIAARDVQPTMVRQDEWREVVGEELANPMQKGEVLYWRDLKVKRRVTGSPIAQQVTPGRRAMSIPVDVTASVSQLIAPNDVVDIIGTFRFPQGLEQTGAPQQPGMDTVTRTVLQNVRVLATGRHMPTAGQRDGGTRGFANITVSVSPEQAEMLVFAQQKGSLFLTVRNPEDVELREDLPAVNWDYLVAHLKDYLEAQKREIQEFMDR